MKQYMSSLGPEYGRSLPARGAWVETGYIDEANDTTYGRSPQGERGLKPPPGGEGGGLLGRSPQGERGLKLLGLGRLVAAQLVAPRKGSVG